MLRRNIYLDGSERYPSPVKEHPGFVLNSMATGNSADKMRSMISAEQNKLSIMYNDGAASGTQMDPMKTQFHFAFTAQHQPPAFKPISNLPQPDLVSARGATSASRSGFCSGDDNSRSVFCCVAGEQRLDSEGESVNPSARARAIESDLKSPPIMVRRTRSLGATEAAK